MKNAHYFLLTLFAFMLASCDIIFNYNMDEAYMIMGTVYKGYGEEPLANCTVYTELDYDKHNSIMPFNGFYDLEETVTDENGRFAFAYKQKYRDFAVGINNTLFYVKDYNMLKPVSPKWNYHMNHVSLRVHGADVALVIDAAEPVDDTVFFGLPRKALDNEGNRKRSSSYDAANTLFAAPEDFENGRCVLNLTLMDYGNSVSNPFCYYGVGRADFYRAIARDTAGGTEPDTSQALIGRFIGFPLKDTLRLSF